MDGEFIGIWSETWREIWEPIASHENAPPDLFCELFRELSGALKNRPTIEVLADIIDDPEQSLTAFQQILETDLAGEKALITFLENTYENLNDLAGDTLANPYFGLLEAAIEKFSLRYDLRRPCTLCPTLQGIFSSLMSDLRTMTNQDTHLNNLMKDFENALRDLRIDCSDGRIRICIQRQMNLLEAIGRVYPDVTQTTLGRMCNQINTWPHEKVREAMQNLYTFSSDYPGIRHSGTPASAIRTIEMRDMVAMCLVLAGFTPYLTNQINADDIYQRK